jgi:hypothetical protein
MNMATTIERTNILVAAAIEIGIKTGRGASIKVIGNAADISHFEFEAADTYVRLESLDVAEVYITAMLAAIGNEADTNMAAMCAHKCAEKARLEADAARIATQLATL